MSQRGQPLSVSRLLFLLKQSVGRVFASVLVTGEVVDPLLSQRGHLYFRLSDGQAELKAVMWRSEVERSKVQLEPGDQITVRGSLDIYAQRGDLQLVATALIQSGRGQQMLALSQLKDKLRREGLFDRPRRVLPRFPLRVGVVSSVGSAVIHDIFQSVQKRFPRCQLILSPSAVSGERAPAELVLALKRLVGRVEVVIVARGGGSFEELLSFSDEHLVRTVVDYPVPVVSAVGHGSDHTLLDLAADHTAPTPTAAAVLVTPDKEELGNQLQLFRERAKHAISQRLNQRQELLERMKDLCRSFHPQRRLRQQRAELDHIKTLLPLEMERSLERRQGRLKGLTEALKKTPLVLRLHTEKMHFETFSNSLDRVWNNQMEVRRAQLRSLRERLSALGPRTLLQRGFAMVYLGPELVTRSEGRTLGEELELHFADGRILAEIKRVEAD